MAGTVTNSTTARGTYVGVKEGMIIMSLPDTDYRLHLVVDRQIDATIGKPIEGCIRARAKRVDVIRSGGRFIEPVYGRPRRVQGRIIATDAQANTITVRCACPIECELTANQQAARFTVGQLVSFDIESGATFEPVKTE